MKVSFSRHFRQLAAAVIIVILSASCEKIGIGGRIAFSVKGVATKSTAVTSGNIGAVYGQFTTDVWVTEDGDDRAEAAAFNQPPHFIETATVSYDADATPYKWSLNEEKYWLNNVGLCFWSWAPVVESGRTIRTATNRENGTLPFSYTLPSPNGTSDAASQKDLLFAFNYEKRTGATLENAVDITFYHALAMVNFMVDTEDGTFNNSYRISNVRIKNIYSSADCTFIPSQLEAAGKFEWTGHSVTSSYGQNYNAATWKDEIHDQAFMIIPQTTPGEAQLEVTFITAGGASLTRTVAFNGEEWKAGKYFKYKVKATSLDNKISFDCIVNDWANDGEILLE